MKSSWKSSVGHAVSLYELSASGHGGSGVLFSMLIYCNEHIMRLGVTEM